MFVYYVPKASKGGRGGKISRAWGTKVIEQWHCWEMSSLDYVSSLHACHKWNIVQCFPLQKYFFHQNIAFSGPQQFIVLQNFPPFTWFLSDLNFIWTSLSFFVYHKVFQKTTYADIFNPWCIARIVFLWVVEEDSILRNLPEIIWLFLASYEHGAYKTGKRFRFIFTIYLHLNIYWLHPNQQTWNVDHPVFAKE